MALESVVSKVKSLVPPPAPFLQKWMRKKAAAPAQPSVRLACELGKTKVVLMEAIKMGEELQVTKFHQGPRPKEDKELAPLMRQWIQEKAFQTQRVRLAIKGQGVVIRFVQFPKMEADELRGAITFEAEKYIPFKADEVIVDSHILEESIETSSGPMMNVLLVAVKKEEIYPLIGLFQDTGLQVEFIDVASVAFFNVLEFLHPDLFKASVGILDFGCEISTLGIVKNGKPQFIRDISFGSFDLFKRVKRKLGIPSEEVIQQVATGQVSNPQILQEITEGLRPLISELKVSLDYYMDQLQLSSHLDKIFISGEEMCYPPAIEILAKNLEMGIEQIDLAEKVKVDPAVDVGVLKQNRGLLPTVLGLCWREP